MIPKKIHYCWFGRGPKPQLAQKCLDSWKKYCPGYEIIEWNEDNFDINCNDYVKEAYEHKKYAFVTDYVRLFALYNYGGIYMDTDVEVLKNLDFFLNNKAFSSFENNNRIPTGIMGSEKGNKWIKCLLKYYDSKHFVKADRDLDLTTNVETITKITVDKYHINLNDTFQDLGDVTIYSHEWLCPKDWKTGKIFLTKNSYTIHHFNGSWLTKDEQKLKVIREKLIGKFGDAKGLKKYKKYLTIYDIKRKLIKLFTNPKQVYKKFFKQREAKNDD